MSSPEIPDTLTQAPREKIVFTLVHGTFAKGADWVTNKNGTFRTGLKKRLPDYDVEFDDAFAWGYDNWQRFRDNTEDARARGIRALAEHLRGKTSPYASHFVVAHSHGGNVALQAMNDSDVREGISGVICMATPFLFSRERVIQGGQLGRYGLGLAIMGLVLYTSPGFLTPVLRYMLITLIGLYSLVFVTVLRSRFISSAKPVRNYRGIEGMNGRLMVIRPGGDEASGLLRTSQFITWSLGGMLNKVERLMGLLIAISMILTYVREGSSKFEWLKQLLAPLLRHADRFDLDPIVGGLLVTTGTIVVLMAVQWLAVSFDRVGWFAEVEMLVEESPAGMTSHAVVLEPQGASRGYVHTSIYNRSQTLDEIASWVKQKVRAPVEPALT